MTIEEFDSLLATWQWTVIGWTEHYRAKGETMTIALQLASERCKHLKPRRKDVRE